MLGRNLDDAEQWIQQWSSQISERAEAAQRLSSKVSEITASASGADGAVKVTVVGSGAVTGLELDDRIQRMAGSDLAKEILKTMRKAQGKLNEKVAAAVQETVGADSETGRAVLGSFEQRFPVSNEEEGEHRGR